eukprot:CAMPEP_0115835570 /NCGR_PEP_ID=MMETSP0287-20121206/4261_1 /TAXON_ID=412157 /ORGANISM="Chrysochromulina rotalis, Strain UIO044" /LENGTH=118 /DNA_ID=CAMNT_0003289029 /DNA_START=466 /DNA_END=823 /DNA_ORIENTATION=+
MPHVYDEDQSRLVCLIVNLVLERVVKQDDLTLDPSACLTADDDLAVTLWDDDPKMRAQARVRRPAVCSEPRAWAKQREDAEPTEQLVQSLRKPPDASEQSNALVFGALTTLASLRIPL